MNLKQWVLNLKITAIWSPRLSECKKWLIYYSTLAIECVLLKELIVFMVHLHKYWIIIDRLQTVIITAILILTDVNSLPTLYLPCLEITMESMLIIYWISLYWISLYAAIILHFYNQCSTKKIIQDGIRQSETEVNY